MRCSRIWVNAASNCAPFGGSTRTLTLHSQNLTGSSMPRPVSSVTLPRRTDKTVAGERVPPFARRSLTRRSDSSLSRWTLNLNTLTSLQRRPHQWARVTRLVQPEAGAAKLFARRGVAFTTRHPGNRPTAHLRHFCEERAKRQLVVGVERKYLS